MAVQCSTLNAENCEFMFDTGSEEYVFNPGFPPRGKVLSQPLGMRPPMLVRLGNQDMKLCGPSGAANCRVALQIGTVSKNVLCDGEMIDAGNWRPELDSDDSGGRYLIHRARVCLEAKEVRRAPVLCSTNSARRCSDGRKR